MSPPVTRRPSIAHMFDSSDLVARPPATLGGRLHHEWSRMRTRPAALRRAADWGIVTGPLHDLDQILEAVGYEVRSTATTESNLRALVLRSIDDDLAARVVIQRLLPGLLGVTRRRQQPGVEVFAELLGAAWISIRTFRPTRQPSCIAAALISDADYRAFRMAWRRTGSHQESAGSALLEALPADLQPHAADELREVFEQALVAGMDPADIELLARIVAEVPTEQIAAALDVTARTVRNRRDRVTDRLREIVLVA